MRIVTRIGAAAYALLLAGPSLAAEEGKGIISPTDAWEVVWGDVLIDLFVIGGVFGLLAVYMLIKFRAKGPNAVGTAKPLTAGVALAFALVPAALFMADDFLLAAKGWSLWNIQRTVPAGAMEVKVVGSQWSFEFDYGNGIKSGELVVPVGKPIVLRLTSTDVIHSFGLSHYRLKEDLVPGRINHLWFYPDKAVETFVTCQEFCGDSHSVMNAPVKAVPQADFDKWLASKKKASLKAPSFASLTIDPAI